VGRRKMERGRLGMDAIWEGQEWSDIARRLRKSWAHDSKRLRDKNWDRRGTGKRFKVE